MALAYRWQSQTHSVRNFLFADYDTVIYMKCVGGKIVIHGAIDWIQQADCVS